MFLYAALRSFSGTWRVRTVADFAAEITEPVIFAIWHNRLALAMEFWARVKRRQPHLKLGALVSASRDGGLLACTLEHFGVQPVRGSSSRRGPQALRESVTLVNAGYCVAITPDGPRGPKYKVQPGIISLAQLTGRPIIAAGARIHPRKTLRSWDQFQVPLPFSECELTFSGPLFISRDASAEEREGSRLQLEQTLLAANPD